MVTPLAKTTITASEHAKAMVHIARRAKNPVGGWVRGVRREWHWGVTVEGFWRTMEVFWRSGGKWPMGFSHAIF